MGQFRDVDAGKNLVPGSEVNGTSKRVVIDSELMADIGHQLRNQLNAVLGAAGLLSSGAESGEERELASIVEAGAEQVARLVDDVLDAAIMQSGDLELALHPFDLRSCVEMCIAMVADGAGAKSLDLSFGAQPDVPSIVVGDSKRLEQILLTLLHGAVDRTFRGGVGIELTSEDRGGLVALHFTIRDTGRGVPARILRGGLDGAPAAHEHMEPGDRLGV